MFEEYNKFISQYVLLNSLEWKLFKSKIRAFNYNKGDIIHHAGEVCSSLMFINYGIVRAYILSDNGSDQTWGVFFNDENAKMENVYAVDYDSFINQRKSKLSFEVIEDCELLSISYKDLQSLYKHSKKSEKFGRIMTELAYSYIHNLCIDRKTKTALERYNKFMEQSPYILQKIPQQHIATFLGITPQSLCRIKKQSNYPM